MNSEKFTLNSYDWIKGLQMYLITTILMSVGSIIVAPNFSVFSADWITILMNTVDVSVIATASYLIKNFLTPANSV